MAGSNWITCCFKQFNNLYI